MRRFKHHSETVQYFPSFKHCVYCGSELKTKTTSKTTGYSRFNGKPIVYDFDVIYCSQSEGIDHDRWVSDSYLSDQPEADQPEAMELS